MLPQEIIRAKRDGRALSAEAVRAFVAGIADGSLADSQVGAFAMAVLLKGMSTDETVALTLAMRDSGTVIDWRARGVPGPIVDKHSTGGIGDKVSLMLAPLLAACGAYVPMISGRGLGHSGGTLDKLSALPGYRTDVDLDTFARVVRETGCAIIGQTADLAPADRRLYAIRDVTATVESLPLITGSILSKKLAAGLDALVLDVKVGSGAFMATMEDARALATSLVRVAQGAGVATSALITDMDQVLGRTAGNALEVAENIALLKGEPREPRLTEVALALTAEALVLGKLAPDVAAARAMAQAKLDDGSAAERFARMVAALGGPKDVLSVSGMAVAPVVREVQPERPGRVFSIDGRALGLAIIEMGGGRILPNQGIDTRVGFSDFAALGEVVDAHRPLCRVHAADETAAEAAAARVRAAVALADTPPALPAEIRERIA
jgi:thymidine phosphorylase